MSETMLGSQVMMANYKKIDGVTRVSEALKMMKEEGLNAMLIESRDESDVFGILTLKDIARKVISQRRKLHETHVYEVMSKPVISVDPQMDVKYCIKLFNRFGLSRAPVVEDGKIIGLVSYTDIVLKSVMMQKENSNPA